MDAGAGFFLPGAGRPGTSAEGDQAEGNSQRTCSPPSGRLEAAIYSPCASTSCRAMASPRPAPPEAHVRDLSPRQKRLKMCGSSSSGTPGPLSFTLTETVSPSLRTSTDRFEMSYSLLSQVITATPCTRITPKPLRCWRNILTSPQPNLGGAPVRA